MKFSTLEEQEGTIIYTQPGGGTEYLCLPDDPQYLEVVDDLQGTRARIYGAEYESGSDAPRFRDMYEHNIPCFVEERSNKIMIPAKIECPSSWTREYYGYLMSANHGHTHQSSFECMDLEAESIAGENANTDGALFYFTEVLCNGFDCPPYENGGETTCVACTH